MGSSKVISPISLLLLASLVLPIAGASGTDYSYNSIEVGMQAINDIMFVEGKETVIAVTAQGDLVIYDFDGNFLHHEEFSHELYCVAVSPDGQKAAVGSRDLGNGSAEIYIVSPVNGKLIGTIETSHGGIYSMEFSHDSSLLAATSGDGTLFLFDTSRWDVLVRENYGVRTYSASFSPDDSYILSGDIEGRLHMYHVYDEEVMTVKAHDDDIFDTLWYNESTVFSCGREGMIKMFDTDLKQLGTLSEHDDTVFRVEAVSDGNYLLSAGEDGMFIIWDMGDLSVAYKLGSADYSILSVGIHSSGSYGVFGTHDSRIVLVDFDPDSDGQMLRNDDYPYDPAASKDKDGDGFPDEWNRGMSHLDSTTSLVRLDDLPDDAAASLDTDSDGYPDEWNMGKGENDSITDLRLDDFPDDAAASLDSDGDGYPDGWNDNMTQEDSTTGLKIDKYPFDPQQNGYDDAETLLTWIVVGIIAGAVLVVMLYITWTKRKEALAKEQVKVERFASMENGELHIDVKLTNEYRSTITDITMRLSYPREAAKVIRPPTGERTVKRLLPAATESASFVLKVKKEIRTPIAGHVEFQDPAGEHKVVRIEPKKIGVVVPTIVPMKLSMKQFVEQVRGLQAKTLGFQLYDVDPKTLLQIIEAQVDYLETVSHKRFSTDPGSEHVLYLSGKKSAEDVSYYLICVLSDLPDVKGSTVALSGYSESAKEIGSLIKEIADSIKFEATVRTGAKEMVSIEVKKTVQIIDSVLVRSNIDLGE